MREPIKNLGISYVNAQSILYKRLSDHTHTHIRSKSLKRLIRAIKYKYNLRIKLPRNIQEAIDIGASLFDNPELKAKMSRLVDNNGSPIENRLAKYLDDAKIKYIREYRIGRYRVDFMIPSKSLVIECQGYTWHNSYPKSYEDMEREIMRNNTIIKAGYRILYYSGRYIYKYGNKIINDILSLEDCNGKNK